MSEEGSRTGRVLIVEDDDTLRETLEEVMCDEGHDVRSAANGRDALRCLDTWAADVVILDLMMPLMDAYEFRDHQRRAASGYGASVLIVSAARDIEAAASRLEADAWLAKPFTVDAMIEAVARLVERQPPARPAEAP